MQAAASNSAAADRTTALAAILLMGVIVMMVLPVPSFLLDIGLTLSFALAILIFTVTLFIERPLEFSSFPTVLLASLTLRLALNVSSTKLIISEGHTGPGAAGGVIEGFAVFVMGGNVFLGLVVFCVLLIVNFMVITKGAGRMAEVGARFALDAMPGKQLAIDSDVAAGAISHEEAKARRKLEQDETTFFGSLDGASKFVKGDAVAGLLITVLNLVVGLAVGVSAHGLSMGEAVESYSMLTVGDGLVSQIPSVIISIAAAMLLSKGGLHESADRALLRQLGAKPQALVTVGAIMGAFGLMPGLPFLPFAAGSVGLFVAAHYARRKTLQSEQESVSEEAEEPLPVEKPLGDVLDVDEIHVEFANDLIPLALDSANGVEPRIKKIRRYIAQEFGFVIPPLRLTDNSDLAAAAYTIKIQGVVVAKGTIMADRLLVIVDEKAPPPIAGDRDNEPVYGAPAMWIDAAAGEEAAGLGLSPIEPAEVVSTHLLEVIKQNFSKLVTRRSIHRVIDEFCSVSDVERAARNRALVDEFIPERISIEFVQSVMRGLLSEMAPIRNLPVILEAIAEGKLLHGYSEDVVEFVRQRIAGSIVAGLVEEGGALPLIQLDPGWEEIFNAHQIDNGEAPIDIALPPELFNRLANSVSRELQKAAESGRNPAIVTTSRHRRFVHTALNAKKVRCTVISYNEVGSDVSPALIGVAASE